MWEIVELVLVTMLIALFFDRKDNLWDVFRYEMQPDPSGEVSWRGRILREAFLTHFRQHYLMSEDQESNENYFQVVEFDMGLALN